MKIKLIKFRDNLILPIRAHYNDAGIDCFAQEDFILADIVKVPLGFGLIVPDGYQAVIKPRSSMNSRAIITQIGTIDSGYRGEISAILIKVFKDGMAYDFKRGDKICQIVIEPVILADIVEDLGEERGEGGFGSTGR